jgi:uncharacterized protein YbcI
MSASKDGRLRSLSPAIAELVEDQAAPGFDDAIVVRVAAAVGRSYHDQFGRSPDHVHAVFCSSDVLLVISHGVLTDVERAYTTPADHARLRESRTLLQYVSRSDFSDPVEQITGRIVRALISGIDVQSDVATETFILEPDLDSNPFRFALDRRARKPERRESADDRRSHTDYSST